VVTDAHGVAIAWPQVFPARHEVVAAGHEVSVDQLEVRFVRTELRVALTLAGMARVEVELRRGLVGLGFVSGKSES
jgi:hypothetical protein